MDFIYYATGRSAITREDLTALGLAYLLPAAAGPTCAPIQPGPDGAAGCVFTFGAGSLQSAGGKGGAEWRPLEGSHIQVMVPAGDLPGPADLARRHAQPGHTVRLGDGRRWLVPVARLVGGDPGLPTHLRRVDGRWRSDTVRPEFADLFADACRIWDKLESLAAGSDSKSPQKTDDEQITVEIEADIAVRALAVNYRIGPVGVDLLGLLDTDTVWQTLKALIDWPAIEDLSKKALEPPSSPPGGGDS